MRRIYSCESTVSQGEAYRILVPLVLSVCVCVLETAERQVVPVVRVEKKTRRSYASFRCCLRTVL